MTTRCDILRRNCNNLLIKISLTGSLEFSTQYKHLENGILHLGLPSKLRELAGVKLYSVRRHQVSACKSKRRCQKCHRKHHTSICQTPLANQQQNNLTTDAQTLTNGAAILHASTPQSPAVVLLKTAIATVSSSHTHCEAPILFDEGAQRSFNTASLASELQLPEDGTETVCLSTFGGNNNEVQHWREKLYS